MIKEKKIESVTYYQSWTQLHTNKLLVLLCRESKIHWLLASRRIWGRAVGLCGCEADGRGRRFEMSSPSIREAIFLRLNQDASTKATPGDLFLFLFLPTPPRLARIGIGAMSRCRHSERKSACTICFLCSIFIPQYFIDRYFKCCLEKRTYVNGEDS